MHQAYFQKQSVFLLKPFRKAMSVKVDSVSKYYGVQKALNQVSFEIQPGEVVGFLGPNGAGKSTMMKIITGFLKPSDGEISVCGFNVREHTYEVQKLIGYLPEHNPLYLDMYVKEYLGMVARLYRIAHSNNRIGEVIEQTGLIAECHKKIGSLSKGYRQRVGLAQALLPDPKVLILDEPTTGLDPNQIIEVRELIRKIGEQKTVMLSTHIMQEVEAICQRIIIINKGEIVARGNAAEVIHSTRHHSVVEVEFERAVDIALLQQVPLVESVASIDGKRFVVTAAGNHDVRGDLFRFAVANNLTLLGLSRKESQLEDVFHQLTMPEGLNH